VAVKPWRNWYHCVGNTYGTWLPGDARGWRARHHRDHVDGDYKNPPPDGVGDALYEWVKANLKREVVVFSREQRQLACLGFGEALTHYGVEVVEVCVGSMHYHVLARFTPPDEVVPRSGERGLSGAKRGAVAVDERPRLVIGKCKSWVTRCMKRAGHYTDRDGGLWAARCKVLPINDRSHQVRVARYLKDHAKQGAAVWTTIKDQH